MRRGSQRADIRLRWRAVRTAISLFLWRILTGLAGLLIASAVQAEPYRLLVVDGHRVKWGAPDLGTGAEVTYGFADRHHVFPDAVNCGALAPVELLAPAWGDDPARLARIAADAFAMWSDGADLRFRPVTGAETPDILIGAQAMPHRVAFANVWLDRAGAAAGVAPLERATICFNPAIPWDAQVLKPMGLDFGTVLAHEIGHAIGLDHPGATGALMGYQNQGDIDALMPGDVAGAIVLYGPPSAR